MKVTKYISIALMAAFAFALDSCKNGNPEFSDYEGGSSVYFARQHVVRNVVLGNDETRDNTDENNHVFYIVSTMGGTYHGRDITLETAVDNSLCDRLYFEDGVTPVKPMPANYYSIPSTTVSYNGSFQGRLQVKLEDAFFNDPASVTGTYVIPIVIKGQVGADRILSGTPAIEGSTPSRTNAAAWNVAPKDYVLYCVKYMNPWSGYYLRSGEDKITHNGNTETKIRKGASVEKNEVCQITTKSLKECIFPVSINKTVKDAHGNDVVQAVTCRLKLSFDENGNCAVSSETSGMTATGTGKFTSKGATNEKAWGGKNRDLLTLEYRIDFGGGLTMESKDEFVAQTRGNTNGVVEFKPQYK